MQSARLRVLLPLLGCLLSAASSTRPECSIMLEIEEERSQCLAEITEDNQTSGMGATSSISDPQAHIPGLTSALSVPFLFPLVAAGCWLGLLWLMLSSYVRRERCTVPPAKCLSSLMMITHGRGVNLSHLRLFNQSQSRLFLNWNQVWYLYSTQDDQGRRVKSTVPALLSILPLFLHLSSCGAVPPLRRRHDTARIGQVVFQNRRDAAGYDCEDGGCCMRLCC
uniref:Uncharacterized protein n=1 Tax=Pavo cristatus TaxID=9049 RepID=A0A8C9F5U9_PAVCR